MAIPLDPQRGQGRFRTSGRGSSRSRGIRVPETQYGIKLQYQANPYYVQRRAALEHESLRKKPRSRKNPKSKGRSGETKEDEKIAEARDGETPGRRMKCGLECAMPSPVRDDSAMSHLMSAQLG